MHVRRLDLEASAREQPILGDPSEVAGGFCARSLARCVCGLVVATASRIATAAATLCFCDRRLSGTDVAADAHADAADVQDEGAVGIVLLGAHVGPLGGESVRVMARRRTFAALGRRDCKPRSTENTRAEDRRVRAATKETRPRLSTVVHRDKCPVDARKTRVVRRQHFGKTYLMARALCRSVACRTPRVMAVRALLLSQDRRFGNHASSAHQNLGRSPRAHGSACSTCLPERRTFWWRR